MFPLIKLLKIALPVATITSATIATVSLVSSKKEDEILDSEREDRVLDDVEKPAEKFEEQIMLYSEDGTQESKTITKEELEQLSKTNSNSVLKGSSSSTTSIEPSIGVAVELKSKDVPNQDSSSDAVGDLSVHVLESDQKVIEEDPNIKQSLTDQEENRGGKDAEDGGKEDKLSISEFVKAETQNLDNLSSPDTLNNKKEESERGEKQKQGQSEHEASFSRSHEGNKADSESEKGLKSPEGDSDGEGSRDLQIESTNSENNTLDGSVSSDSQASSGSSENMDGASGTDSSSGQENGLQGEHGQGPMTPEQLQRIAAMGAEVETVLGALGSLFRGSF